ncbi:MAG TPA: HAD hydrolase-like protein [Oscillospiraceae bacterium]|nr:HAD hydrolase-like protein [Oscillospiraceae bacterium]
MFKTILLDFDGTVFATGEGIVNSVRYALAKLGIQAELPDLYCFCGPPLADMFMEKYGMDRDTALKAVAYYRERYSVSGWKECEVYPGIREMTRRLRAQGRKVAVATSKPTSYALKIMAQLNMDRDFDLVMGAEFDGTRSEKWEVIAAAMDALGADKDTTVMVGDRKYDVIGAHRCGVPCIGVRYGYAEPGEFESAGADFVVDGVEELCKLIESKC